MCGALHHSHKEARPYAVERIAREDLGMSKKGEVVYMLPKSGR